MDEEVFELIARNSARLSMLEETVMQLIEQQVAPDPAAASRFADAMRARTSALLREDPPDHRREIVLTQLLAALLASAGKPPSRG
jgi:hypothetical protein